MGNNSTKSILILDDDSAFRGLLAELLNSRGLDVIEASSGEEATEIIKQNKPILAIVDYKLPEIDGLSWITRLRESGNNCPLVFVSQISCDAKTFSWLRNILKVALILQKPIIPELFLQQIEDLLPPQLLEQSVQDKASKLERLDKLAHVKAEYAKGLASAWEELTLAIGAVQKNPEDASAIAEAVQLAHKLTGTAGSIGFKRVGEIADTIHNLLRALDPVDTMQQVVWAEIFRSLADGEALVRNSTRACEATLQGKDSLAARRILLFGKEEHFKDKVRNLQTTIPVEIELPASLSATSQRIKGSAFDAVIFDLSMDDNSKIFQLAKEIRLLPGYESLPFGFISKSLLGFMSKSLKTSPQVDLVYAGCSALLPEIPKKTEIEQACNKLLSFKQVNKPRILTVDDDAMLTNYIAGILTEEGMLVSSLNKPIEIMEAVENLKPDLILLDVIMPGLSGYDVCRQLRSDENWSHIPIIFLTAKSDQTGRAAAFHAGGNDFLSKPILAEELIVRVKSQLDLAKQNRLVSKNDQYTGVLNRNDFTNAATALLASAQAGNLPATVSLLSIDDFAHITFTRGLSAAQEILLALRNLIQCRFRAEDIRGCLGEETFAIAFSGEQQQTIAQVMNKLLEEFAAIKFTGTTGALFYASFTTGLAEYPADGCDLYTLLDKANHRLVPAMPAGATS